MDISVYTSLNTTLASGGSREGLTISTLAKSGQSALNVSGADSGDSNASGDSVTISEEGKTLAAQGVATEAAQATASNASTAISGSFMSMNGASSAAGAPDELKEPSDAADTAYEKILKEISELKQKIREVEKDPTLTEEQRKQKVQQLQSQLLAMLSQLVEAKAKSGDDPLTYRGGTRAEGASFQLISHMLPVERGTGDA
jgi:chromosome segregation ATPase